MKNESSIILSIVVIFLVIVFIIGGVSFLYKKTFGVANENVNREIFERSQSYVQGKTQELIKLHHEWINSDNENKILIESTIRMSFADFDENKITSTELRDFLKGIKYK